MAEVSALRAARATRSATGRSERRGESKPAQPEPVPSVDRMVVENEAAVPRWKPKFPFLLAIADQREPFSR